MGCLSACPMAFTFFAKAIWRSSSVFLRGTEKYLSGPICLPGEMPAHCSLSGHSHCLQPSLQASSGSALLIRRKPPNALHTPPGFRASDTRKHRWLRDGDASFTPLSPSLQFAASSFGRKLCRADISSANETYPGKNSVFPPCDRLKCFKRLPGVLFCETEAPADCRNDKSPRTG